MTLEHAGAASRRLVDGLLAVLLAPRCAACDRPLDAPTRGPVCAGCWRAIERVTPPLCDACGDGLASWRVASRAAGRCARCRRAPRAVDRGRAIGAYDGALRAIVRAFKYEGRRSLARPLASLMRAQGSDVLAGAERVVPVPLHWRRRRARGFNQAADLAARLDLPLVDALVRLRATPSQTGLPAGRRHANVRGAFAATPGGAAAVAGRCVVLVDDVVTTAATLEACARVLKAAGAREVRALTAARAWRRRP